MEDRSFIVIIEEGTPLPPPPVDALDATEGVAPAALLLGNSDRMVRNWAANFAGVWSFGPASGSATLSQSGCCGTFSSDTYQVRGDNLTASANFYQGLTGWLELGASEDSLIWHNGAVWTRKHSAAAVSR